MTSFLVVPIDVEALVVTAAPAPANTGFAPALTRFDALPYREDGTPAPFNSEKALATPFASTNGRPGVHVHWAMPDALMRATRSDRASGAASIWNFPQLPDRWLVTRVARVPSQSDVVRSWVVDSAFVSTTTSGAEFNVASNAVPWQNADDPLWKQPPYRYLGRSVPLAYWPNVSNSADRIDRLDATRFGTLELAAFYPNTVNVFGLYDPLDDLASTDGIALSYSVTGWHAAAGDPVSGKSPDEIAATLTTYKWQVDLTDPPDATAYCGMVNAIDWSSNLTPTAPQPLSVTIGNTTSEALSALIVKSAQPDQSDGDALEFQLHALLTSQLPVLADTAGQRLVTRQLHKLRFSPVPGLSTWYARRRSDGADISATLNEADRGQIDQLNSLQADADRLSNVVADERWQVFADWFKYLEVAHGANAAGLDPEAVAAFMQGSDQVGGPVTRPDAPLPKLAADVAALDAAQATLNTAVARLRAPAIRLPYDIAQKPAEIFFQPSDPTLLLSGADVVPALRYGGDGFYNTDGTLTCRMALSLVSTLAAPQGAVGGSAAVGLGASDAPALAIASDPTLPAAQVAQANLLETLLLWPAWSGARLAVKAANDATAWTGWTQAETSAFLLGQPQDHPVFTGAVPSPVGVNLWDGNPWLPIMMHWDISYWPTELLSYDSNNTPMFDSQMIISRLNPANDALDSDGVDLTLAGALSAIETSYQGITFITPHAGYAAYNQLKKYAADNPGSPLAPVASQATVMPLLSQALSGFHDRFLLRKRTLQVEVRDPSFSGPDDYAFMQQVIAAVDAAQSQTNTTAPMVEDQFCPIRAGLLELKRIWLVDAFGQSRDYPLASNALSLAPARSVSPQRMYAAQAAAPAFMPPRISQPAMLQFNWLAARGDGPTTGTQPSSTPICGWLVPNYLDESLMIYDADGTALGSIAQVDASLKWLGAPTNAATYAQSTPEPQNVHLADFTDALLKRTPAYLVAFLDTLNAASATIQPLQHAQSAQIPVLVGQPLALVRTSLTLSLLGVPAINNSWSAFEQDLASQKSPSSARTTNGHEAVQFPVLIGSVEDPDDGLLGFYLGSNFGTFYSVVATEGTDPATRKIDTVKVSVACGPTTLTMIVDPRCQVHATTGYMPTQSLQVPTEMFRDAFARLAVTFLTAPVLSPVAPLDAATSVALPLPLPGQQKGQWSWITIQANGGVRAPLIQPAVQAQPDQPFSHPAYALRDGWLGLSGFEDPDGG